MAKPKKTQNSPPKSSDAPAPEEAEAPPKPKVDPEFPEGFEKDSTPHVPTAEESRRPDPDEFEHRNQEDVPNRVKHNEQGGMDEILVRFAEPRALEDQPLPDILKLLGQESFSEEEIQAQGEPRMYQTTVQNSTLGNNLIIYPAVSAGRCELCGSTRFVDRRDGTKGEVWKVVNRKNGEFRFVYRRGEWLEVSAATCPHYRHVNVMCSYCGEGFTGSKDKKGAFTETLASRILYVFAEKSRPRDLIMVCSDFNCKLKFDDQYHLNQKL